MESDFAYGPFTLCGRLSQNRSAILFQSLLQSVTPECTHSGLGSSHFARRYSGNRFFFLFLRLLRCFSSPGSLPYVMDWRMDAWNGPCRFPHSDISGSMDICSSPKLFAAYHVFHRLSVPRHPPYALCILTICCCIRRCKTDSPYHRFVSCSLDSTTPSVVCMEPVLLLVL